ncbi:hypothetical protein HNY73_011528 [Argiope bruennichi]|uniref:Uncharacterized protein n=1 Tax=Argiope bruennichi TaxID=94029 RepID=A0A8T0F1M6_ARGBR|nr:hypothetical protein HNY73_011528 [Argiope bruennichi]
MKLKRNPITPKRLQINAWVQNGQYDAGKTTFLVWIKRNVAQAEGHVTRRPDALHHEFNHLPARAFGEGQTPAITREVFCEIDQFLYDRYVLKSTKLLHNVRASWNNVPHPNGTKTLFAVALWSGSGKHYQILKHTRKFHSKL